MSADGRAPAEEQNRPPNRPPADGGGGGYARIASRVAAAELAAKPRQQRPSSEAPAKGASPQGGGGYAAKAVAAAAKPPGRAPRKQDGSPSAGKKPGDKQSKKLPPPDAPLDVEGKPDEEDKELYDKEAALVAEINSLEDLVAELTLT